MPMSRTDNQIWQMTTGMPNKKQLQGYRSQKIGGRAVQINNQENRGALAIWMTLQLLNDQHCASDNCISEKVLRFVPGRKKGFVFDVWALITSFVIGDNNLNILLPLNTVANYALCLKNRPITRGIFPIVFHPDILVQAVLHGDEEMLRNMLKTNPDLTQKGEGIDFSGREFTKEKDKALTPLQTAIACGDFAPNRNSTDLCELIVKKLKEQYPDKWPKIVHDQTLELYTKSLCFYAKKQAEKIHDLYRRLSEGEKIDPAVIKAEEKRLEAYDRATQSKDLKTIIEAHTNPDPDPTNTKAADAQKDHVIQVDQALIDTIASATDAEIQAVLDDPTINSPLSNLIKQFRKEVDNICQSEIIANPQHLLRLFTLYDAFYTHVMVMNADPNWKKHELFWCHLVGHVQRYLPANDAQIFANPGLHYAVEDAAKNERSFDFRYYSDSGSIFPLSFDSNSGLGYKFGVNGDDYDTRRCLVGRGWARGGRRAVPFLSLLQNLCRAKTARFQNLLHNHFEHATASVSA